MDNANLVVDSIVCALRRTSEYARPVYSSYSDTCPSLPVDVRLDGRILICGHRDCELEDIVQSARMFVSDRFGTAPSTRSAVLPPRRIKDSVAEVKPVRRCWTRLNEHFQHKADMAVTIIQ